MLKHIEEQGPPISELDLKRFEREIRVVLPTDYRAFLLKYNGGRPVPASLTFPFENETMHWSVHFFFGLKEPVEACCLLWNEKLTKQTRPPGTIPIANDEGGNFFYLRWSEPDAGSVHFGPTPSNGDRIRLYRICASFTDFLDRLCEVTES